MNRSGFPNYDTYAIASNLLLFIYLGPPIYEEGKIYFFPISFEVISLFRDASFIEL